MHVVAEYMNQKGAGRAGKGRRGGRAAAGGGEGALLLTTPVQLMVYVMNTFYADNLYTYVYNYVLV